MFPDEMREVVSHVLSKTVGDLAKERMEEIKRWIQLAADLAPAEEELKSQMSVRRRKNLQNKKLVLTEMLLRDAGHSDTEVIKDLTSGFDLTGMLPESGSVRQERPPCNHFMSGAQECCRLEQKRHDADCEIFW